MTVPLLDNVPTPSYRIGFTAGVLDDLTTITWTDITSFTYGGIERLRVLSRKTSAGKAQEFANVGTSRGVYVVDDSDHAFDIANTSSPYYPHVLPGIIFQERQTWAGVTYTVYTGYVDDITLEWEDQGLRQVSIACLDAFDALNLQILDDSRWKIEVRRDVSANIKAGHNTAWIPLGDASNSKTAIDIGGQGWTGDYQNNPTLGNPSLIPGDSGTSMDVAHNADQRASLPYKALLTQFPFTVEVVFRAFQNRAEDKGFFAGYDGPVNIQQVIQAWIGTDGVVSFVIGNPYATAATGRASTLTVDDGVVHHICFVMPTSDTIHIWIDGSDFTDLTTGGAATFPFPTGMVTGITLGNFPAAVDGDYGFDGGVKTDSDGKDTHGGLQSFVFYDGLALSSARIGVHASAAIFGWGVETTGVRFNHVMQAIGWPANNFGADAGSTNVQAAMPTGTGSSVLSYLQLLAETEGGRVLVNPSGVVTFLGRTRPLTDTRARTSQAIFSDADGTGAIPTGTIPYVHPIEPHLNNLDVFTRASVTRMNGIDQIYDSIPANNAPRTITKSNLLMADDRSAAGLGQYLVSQSKTARPTIHSLTIKPQQSPTTAWPVVLGMLQGDRITVRRHPSGGSAVDTDWIVEGIEHDWGSGTDLWTTTVNVSPADPNTYFVLGTSVLGGNDLLFY